MTYGSHKEHTSLQMGVRPFLSFHGISPQIQYFGNSQSAEHKRKAQYAGCATKFQDRTSLSQLCQDMACKNGLHSIRKRCMQED